MITEAFDVPNVIEYASTHPKVFGLILLARICERICGNLVDKLDKHVLAGSTQPQT